MTTNIGVNQGLTGYITVQESGLYPELKLPVENIKVCAVIPALNEAETIGKIVRETGKYIDDIFVVDNGCNDGTAEIARQNGAEVIQYDEKQGYGAAQYAGQQAAIERGFHYILQIDGDGQHKPQFIPQLVLTAVNGNYDLVLGSRFLTDSYKKFSFTRRAGIRFFSRVVSILGRTNVTDVTSGFKVYKASSLRQMRRPCDRHPAIEQVLSMAKHKMKIKEVPVEMRDRKNGHSHLSLKRFIMYPVRAMSLILTVLWVESR